MKTPISKITSDSHGNMIIEISLIKVYSFFLGFGRGLPTINFQSQKAGCGSFEFNSTVSIQFGKQHFISAKGWVDLHTTLTSSIVPKINGYERFEILPSQKLVTLFFSNAFPAELVGDIETD